MKAGLVQRLRSAWALPAVLVVLVVAFAGTLALRTGLVHLPGRAAAQTQLKPENLDIESQLGIRFSHVAILGGGGLVELTYTVLDPEKATTFQSDTLHPPTLFRAGSAEESVHVSALMKQGHNLRPGQTYFILYENPKGLLHTGDSVDIHSKAGVLAGFPVE